MSDRSGRCGSRSSLALRLALGASLGAIVVGCAPAVPPSASAAPETPILATSPAPERTPRPTPWPGDVLSAVLHLGAADAEIWKGGADFGRAVDAEDLRAMWGAADGIAKLLQVHIENVERLGAYPHTQPLAAAYRRAFPPMLDGATTVRDAIVAGDPEGVVSGTRALVEGVRRYGEVRALLAPYVEQGIRMRPLLVR